MIIVKLVGGLGNQLFAYAAARRLCEARKLDLKLDISSYKPHKHRSYTLHHYNISAEIATPKEVARFQGRSVQTRLWRFLERHLREYHRRHIYSSPTGFSLDPKFLEVPDNTYIKGTFQNELYFKPIEAIIRNEFSLRTALDPANLMMAARIHDANSVALHIRRGDYATNPSTQAKHGLLPLAYYVTAVSKIAEKVAHPEFFVFSDDLEWAREHLRIDFTVSFVDINDSKRDYADLYLMSQCKHHIIANSSFSWWGAWFGEHSSQVVYAPHQWQTDSRRNAHQIIPDRWLQI